MNIFLINGKYSYIPQKSNNGLTVGKTECKIFVLEGKKVCLEARKSPNFWRDKLAVEPVIFLYSMYFEIFTMPINCFQF